MSDILRRARLVRREIFDPTNAEHIESFKTFLRTNSWGAVQFYPEDPYTEAPATVMSKYARHALNVKIETPQERTERLAVNPRLVPMPKLDDTERGTGLAASNELMNTLLSSHGLPTLRSVKSRATA